MKVITKFFCLLIFSFSLFAQSSDEILATANNRNFTMKDFAPGVRQAYEKMSKDAAEARRAMLDQQIAEILLDAEASARKTTTEKLLAAEVRNKITNPSEREIQAVYEANRAALGNKTLKEARPEIAAFLRREAEQKALANFVSNLKIKYKVTPGKDVNAPNLSPSEILATAAGKQISVNDFETKNKKALYELKADFYDQQKASLEQIVYSALLYEEAKARNLETSDLIAREVTDKLREFSNDERGRLQSAFQKMLFQKYNVKFLIKEPAPIVQNISTEGNPSRGDANAPVTVVMFSDFQCPACRDTHPVLQRVLAEYGDKVRFVVRDFPLVTRHENAYSAALAANAANAQGKFFEYVEILYQNQENLDAQSLRKYAADLGLNQKQFDLDLASEKFAGDVKKDLADGKIYGVDATPTVFVNGVKVRALSAQAFRSAIEKALKQ